MTDVEHFDEHLDGFYGGAVISTLNHAEDLIREIYVRAMTAFARPRPDGDMNHWLFTLLRSVRLNQVRNIDIAVPSPKSWLAMEFQQCREPCKDSHDLYVRKLGAAHPERLAGSWPPNFLEIILLREYENLWYPGIASFP